MNSEFDAEPELTSKNGKQRRSAFRTRHSRRLPEQPPGSHPAPGLDFWVFADVLVRRWHWIIIGGILGAAAFAALGTVLIGPKYTALTQLLRYETPAQSESLKTTPLTPETFAGLIVSPDLLRRIGDQLQPPIAPEKLIKSIKVDPIVDSDMVRVFVAARTPGDAVNIANLYGREVVAFTTALQANQAAEVARTYLKRQVADMDQDIAALHTQFRNLPMSGQVTNKLAQVGRDLNALEQHLATTPRVSVLTARLAEKLQTSLADLSDLTSRYTEAHPLVMQKRAQISSLQEQISSASTNSIEATLAASGITAAMVAGPGGPTGYDPEFEIIRARLESLETARLELANRQREAELYASSPPGIVRVFAPATLKTVKPNMRTFKIGAVGVFGAFIGMGCSLLLVLLVEMVDSRLKTTDDVRRVTRLPVLTTLGDLQRMDEAQRSRWAFRTWTLLQGRLSPSSNHGLVCGITSCGPGEGRSTWINLLAEAASLSGFRVLTIATRPSADHVEAPDELTEGFLEQQADMNTSPETNTSSALATNVLNAPAQVTEQLTGPNSQPMVHIPLPGWVWNLDRRKQWRNALSQWRQIENLVILVELPPAAVPEAVLLGSHLPNLLWLADSGQARAGETRSQLSTLRDARCNLVGAVLNRETARPVRRWFPRWVTAFAFCAAMAGGDLRAQNTTSSLPANAAAPAPVAPTNLSFSVVNRGQRAAWQQNLTLGPGDVLTFALFGEPTLTRTEVAIAPDGRVSYLEAQDIMAAGLTVDQLRARVDEAIGEYRRAARSIVTPVAYRSKKYYMLGKVVQRGVYTLDRPITVLEAIARAQGIETAVVEENTLDTADFQRAFLMRGGKRMAVDFERLFTGGDLSQNVPIEPDDYLYFPPTDVREVYVLGEVILPGTVTHRPDLTVMSAISYRGGFNQRAFNARVLVVRGSLNQPETFVVDTMAITTGRKTDMLLRAKDIVYVSHRPWYRAEELFDLAATAFVQSLVTTWVGTDIVRP